MTDTHIIVAGQSNALGYLNTGAAPYVPTARVQIWADTNNDGVGDAWNYMNPGVNTGLPANPTDWGPEVEIANRWLATHATGVLWIDKVTKGSTGLAHDATQLDWSPSSSGEMFDLTTASVDAARHNLDGTAYAFSRWDAVEWMQGETDATDAAKAAAYGTNLTDFLSHARADWDVTEFVIGRISDSTALPYNLAVRNNQFGVDQADANAVSFKTIGLAMQPDTIHVADQIGLGDRFFDAWAL